MPRAKKELSQEDSTRHGRSRKKVIPWDSLTPLQKHGLGLLEQVISVRKHYGGEESSDQDSWLLNATNRAVYAAFIDCIDEGVGDNAKEMLRRDLVSVQVDSKG